MKIWFEGSSEISSSIDKIQESISDIGKHYVDLISLMPGLSNVELVEKGNDYVIIKTNEGLMTRSNITIDYREDRITIELDEEYKAGSLVTARSHFKDEFTSNSNGVTHHTLISDLKAPGILGYLYRKLGSSNIGKAFLISYKTYLESD